MSLQSKLDEIKAGFKTMVPADVASAMDEATNNLIASGLAERALKVGDKAPTFTLTDQDGQTVQSTDLLAKGPLVLTFYRGTWCPYCNLDLQAIEAAASEVRDRGASLAAISQQTASNSRKSHRDNNLSFPVLNDHGGEVAAAFGVRWVIPENLRPIHQMLGADITKFNGEDSWTLPMPARYVIDTDGVIAYAEVNPDYTKRPEPSDLLPTLDRLARS